MIYKGLRLSAILMLMLCMVIPALAQQNSTPFQATVNRTSLTTDDTLTLTLTLDATTGMSGQGLSLPPLDGFDVLGSSTSSQTSIINGVTSATVNYLFQLQPTRTGDLQIPSFTVDLNNSTVSTQAIPVTVTQGTGQPTMPDGRPLPSYTDNMGRVVEAAVDNETPYVGEQVNYTFRLYRDQTAQSGSMFDDPFFTDPFGGSLSANLSFGSPSTQINSMMQQMGMGSFGSFGALGSPFDNTTYQPPDFAGTWTIDQPIQHEFNAQSQDGTPIHVTEITTPFFPTSAGELQIGPAAAHTADPFSMQDSTIQTDPVTLNVQPLPDGAPLDFNGAVGQYEMIVHPDILETKVGEPVTIIVAITGQGNLDLLPVPDWEETENWRTFDTRDQTHTEVVNGIVQGTKAFEILVMPTVEGELTLPTVTFSYFDPVAKTYKTLTSEPTTVAVAPGEFDAIYTPDMPAAPAEAVIELRGIKDTPAELTSESEPLTGNQYYWLLWLLPLAVIAGDMALLWRNRYLHANVNHIRRSRAYKKAVRSLKRAARKHEEPFRVTSAILMAYLTDKIQQPLEGLTHRQLADLLAAQGIAPHLIDQTIDQLGLSEHSRFAPKQTESAHNPLDHTHTIIRALEEEFSL